MNKFDYKLLVFSMMLACGTLTGCSGDGSSVEEVVEETDGSVDDSDSGSDGGSDSGSDDGTGGDAGDDGSDSGDSTDDLAAFTGLFIDGALTSDVTTVECTLSGGTVTTCYSFTIAGEPANTDMGPYCPPSINSDESEGGIWFDGITDEPYTVDGDFIANINNLYGDDWLLHDPDTGLVNITETQEACEAAAQPNVPEEYRNHCVECAIEYTGGPVQQTVLIPVEPVSVANPDQIGRNHVGLTLNGVILEAPAPVDAILSANTIAAFDDCGGHINPVEGYHYHAATGCTEATNEEDGHAALIGYALDGYGIYAMLSPSGEEDFDLDECRGHTDDVRGYHYHVASAAENMFIGCFYGETGSISAAE